jgi:16S rRNA (guanine1516-N2)-methyltransferase
MKVRVYCASQDALPDASERFSHVEWIFHRPTDDYYLEFYDGKIVLQKQTGPEHPLFVDFVSQLRDWKKQKLSAKTDLLGKACGVGLGEKIFDLTLGLGSDSLKLVYFGAEVMAIEKQPLIYELVNDALERYNSESGKKLALDIHFGDGLERAKEYVNSFDVFYMDPMFDLGKRTALPKKKMQFLSDIIGENIDDEFLPTVLFLQDHKKRIVVKRHPHAPVFGGLKPKSVFQGKSIRFEVF